ncbi:putative HTH-type transcriptional regulator gbpR [Roseobacter litoralis Och 149]|uniref:HTH-type transcriptional regulator gbpR n=1 Tax=Roseobacter litoralis (strain ATCC 49566 / DSM 6996 / JCM 21268 / NBRC 15278 / OCh 149) TaxID=391595 RepID=F7ZA16_ROSLO|nr:putative HTH-type transcriptional regulator gbpR [Roseobacter litoralis Och 149]
MVLVKLDVQNLNLRHLRLVHAIADTGQLSVAANQLAISQPAASRTLAEIERLVGEPLFVRNPKGMIATEIGRVFCRHADAIVGQLGSTVSDLNAYQAGQAGTIRIGAVTGPAVGYVVPTVQALKKEAPLAEVSIDVAPSMELLDGLLRDAYDIVLARIPSHINANRLEISRGRVEEVRVLARAGHPLENDGGLGFKDLVDQAWIIQGAGMPIRDAIEQAFVNRNLSAPLDVIDTASLVFTVGYLLKSDTLAAVTAEVANLLLSTRPDGLIEIKLKEELILSPYHLIRRNGHAMSPICDRLHRLLTKELAI